MPCYHFVFHAFGTWHPDHPSGWHQHGVPGALRPSEPIAAQRRSRQVHPAVFFSPDTQQALLHMVHDACNRRAWRAHAVATNVTHLHLVASWTEPTNPVDIHTRLKNLLALRAARANNTRGRPWFSHGGKPRRVRDARHLHKLLQEYLAHQGGLFWKEGDPPPLWMPPTPNR